MTMLRITQTEENAGRYRVEIALEGDGSPRQIATSRFDFQLTAQDRENLRWYLEDYLQFPQDPAPRIAARIEQRLSAIGVELFKNLFQSSDDTRDLWATLRTRLNKTRVEVVTSVREAATIPWELLRDPKTDAPLALRAQAFVRAQPQPAQAPQVPRTGSGPIRILLVICRPGGGEDVPFRSVASRLVKSLSEEARAVYQLDVLRPPTFEQLSRTLHAAKAERKPYHIVHFDGHGTYLEGDPSGGLAGVRQRLSPLSLSGLQTGAHGYLLFENPTLDANMELVDGTSLGHLLVETDVPVLVLNACRSAHADPPPEPAQADSTGDDPHAQVRALGSLAQEVMDAGVAGVVAMRYNVYVVTAAQFVADLYATLIQGRPLGEAVSLGRNQLAKKPHREIAYTPIPLQDWSVPVVYEAAPIALFKRRKAQKLTVTVGQAQAAPERGSLDPHLPKSPDAGFFGRDETLLALDRAFDTQGVVLLHAFAGSGKTATTAEFARWYSLTGGIDGPVLFTSFEQYKPLGRVLDQIGQVFGPALEKGGTHWLTLDDADRRAVALQVLKQVPVLWIWDNVEPVAGFPAGTASAWSAAEQRELVDFLRDARTTQAKFLLTSRRDERAWLGDLPRRIAVPPMPLQERVQLARALAEKHGRRITDVDDWRPLLQFTQGNPLTITVLVGQALRDGVKTRDQIDAFVTRLRAGSAAFDDEASEGRSLSLRASLSYGFENAFTEAERKQLALLHFFQGFVYVDVLRQMGKPDADWCLPEVRGLTREAGLALLDRAAEVGLLAAHGGGYYSIHPALPWFFKGLFDTHYPAPAAPSSDSRDPSFSATRAFVEAMGGLGDYYHDQYGFGDRSASAALAAEEANLLHARQLARTHGWWYRVIGTMQGLQTLYEHTGRQTEWARLVTEIVPDFVDRAHGGPLAGQEEEWGFITHYRVRLARNARRLEEAEHLQHALVSWARQRAAPALAAPAEEWDVARRNEIRSLAAALHTLAQIQNEQRQPKCVEAYKESFELGERIGDQAGAAVCAGNIGQAHVNIPSLRDLAQAELWYQKSLKLCDPRDRQGRALCLHRLGSVAFKRFFDAKEAEQPEDEQLRHLNAALGLSQQALAMLPPDAVHYLAAVHNQLGSIYGEAGDLDNSLPHHRESIRYCEVEGDFYRAAQARYKIAASLAGTGRLADAREYAHAALRNYETFGDRAAEDIQELQKFIAAIEEVLKLGG